MKIIKKCGFALNWLFYRLFSMAIINGKLVVIPRVYRIALGDFITEKWLNDIIRKILQNRSGAFIDVGFNLGQTLIKVKTIKTEQEYYGFEANPMCFYYVNKLAEANKYPGCLLIPVGLSNQPGLVKLYSRCPTDGSASLAQGFKDKDFFAKEQYVPVFEGDKLLDTLNIKALSIIKIDVEGVELEVMEGLRGSIAKFQPYILCEILPVYDERTEAGRLRYERQKKILDILKEEKYGIFRIMRNGELFSLDTIEVHSDMSLRDYIFIPNKEKGKLFL